MIRYPSSLPTAECLAEWPNPDGEPHECMIAAHIQHQVHMCACGANDRPGGES